MQLKTFVRGTLLALAATTSGIALAQYTPAPSSTQAAQPAPGQPQQAQAQIQVSAKAAKALQELQGAVNANDTANIPAKAAAAQAVVQTPQDRYVLAQLQLKAATAAKNDAAVVSALEAMLATGVAPQAMLAPIHSSLADAQLSLKQYDRAAATLEKLIALEPSNIDAKLALSDARKNQGRTADAIALIQQAIKQKEASGQKADEAWYKQAVALAYNAKLPATLDLTREWVKAYPTPANWRDTLRIYRKLNTLDEAGTLDALRLARAAGAMGEPEFADLAYNAIMKGYPGEAKAVLDEGIAAGAVDKAKSPYKEMIAEAVNKSAGEAATLDAAAKKALAAPTAKTALVTGDLLYGYGRYAQAAELYRAALGKTGADPSLINLHLGMALARAGDRAEATAALNAVTGPRAELAKYWLAYVAGRS